LIITKYGISLVRLKKEHIEFVRQKRNLAFIQEKMLYKKQISSLQQKQWFVSINNKNNLYFLIQYKHQFVGLINGKDVDYEKRTGEGGIFIWDKELWNTYIPVAASLILNDFNFLLANFEINYAKVLKSNHNAIQYNLAQGYKIIEEQKEDVVWMQLTRQDYIKNAEKIRRAIQIVSKNSDPLSVNDISFEDDNEETRELLYTGLPEDIQKLIR
jgi:RimJ/RimL family protein N-acetyltransferase